MSKLYCTASALALAFSGAAHAEATPQGAAELTATFQTYLGTVPGVVNVVAEGEEYVITLDATPFFGMIPAEEGVSLSMTPQVLRATDNGDGTWGVVQEQPIDFQMSVQGEMDMSISIANAACTGVFDVALKAFATQDCVFDAMTVHQSATPGGGPEQVTDMTMEKMTLKSTSVAGANGGVDSKSEYTQTGLSQVMDQTMAEGMPPMHMSFSLAESKDTATITGFRSEAFYAALAWAVANPDPALMVSKRLELRDILAGGLPLWEKISATGAGTGLSIETPVGPVSAATFGYDVALTGAVTDGNLTYGFKLDGLSLAPGMVPPFAEALVPQSLSLTVGVESFDAAGAAQKLLGLFDLAPGAEPGPEFEGELLQALLPDGSVDIVLAPGAVSNATYTLSYEGRMQAGPFMMMPSGTAKITAVGYDAAMAVLDGAPDEVKSEVLPAMGIARQFAQEQADGSLVWDIDATVPGTFKVNGMDLMGMQ